MSNVPNRPTDVAADPHAFFAPALPRLDAGIAQALRQRWLAKTQPAGALGAIESLAVHVGQVQHSEQPRIERPQLLVFAGDHGAAKSADSVSAYPSEVTWQMVGNLLAGGAAAAVLARQLGCAITVVDAGVDHAFAPAPGLLDRKIGRGTRHYADEPAMALADCDAALAAGLRIGATADADALLLGEMGIGNTASAALLLHHFSGDPLAECVGAGSGLDAAGIARKLAVLQRAVQRHGDALRAVADPARAAVHALAAYGGYEIAMLAGCLIGAAAARKVVVVDGFTVGAAVLAAQALAPGLCEHLLFAHRSAERAHRRLLAHLRVTPLLDLGMRLGEGSGALLALPLLRASLALLDEMATFESARVAASRAGPP